VTTRPRLLFIGLCAAARDLIVDGAQRGELPTFARLFARGLTGRTRSVEGLYSQCTWPAFYTGTGPAKQGVHSWEQLREGTYEFYRAHTPDHVRTPPFWHFLSRAGRRVAILDVPHSPLTPDINGIQTVEWGAHDYNHGFGTVPAALADEIVARFGRHPQDVLCDADRTPAQLVELRDRLLAGIDGKRAITKHFLAQEDWDFFAQVFTESHCIGHQCWHLHDRSHPRYSDAAAAVAGDPVKDIYVAIDRAIGDILADVDARTTVIVMTCHGMNAKYSAQFMLGDILVRLGLAARQAPPGGAGLAATKRGLDPVLTWAWQRMPAFAQSWLQPLRHGARDWVASAPRRDLPAKLDPAAGQCFVIANNATHGGIRINLAGREPAGVVQPGAECEALLARLERELMALVNVDTGRRIVARTMRTRDLYDSDVTGHFPDLLVEWASADPVTAVRSPAFGRLDKADVYCRTGDHNAGGMFIATGPGIAPGRLDRVVSVMDFAPTFCAALDAPAGGFDGAPIPELVAAVRATGPAATVVA